MGHDVRIENITAARPIAVVRRRASAAELPRVVPAACGVVWDVLRAQHVSGAGRHVAIYLDGQINLEVGVELPAPFKGHGEVVGSMIPSGAVATTTHFGPYGRLHEAHQAIRDWCASHGHALAGPNWEIYGHWVDAWNRLPVPHSDRRLLSPERARRIGLKPARTLHTARRVVRDAMFERHSHRRSREVAAREFPI